MFGRLIEILLGLDRGFLDRQGDLSLRFAPPWPWQQTIGSATWNGILIAGAALLVVWVYRHEARRGKARIWLGLLRGSVLGVLILLLNRPMLTLGQNRIEPSVLAVLVDDSMSMSVPDVASPAGEAPRTRLAVAVGLLLGDTTTAGPSAGDAQPSDSVLRALADKHQVRLYRFGGRVAALGEYASDDQSKDADRAAEEALRKLVPTGQSTRLMSSVSAVLDDLRGRRLAGAVVLTDGRQTPSEPIAPALEALKSQGVRLFPVVIGSDQAPRNIELSSVSLQESAFEGDIVNVKAQLRTTGYEQAQPIHVQLIDRKTNLPLLDAEGKPAEQTVSAGAGTVEAEVQFKPSTVGVLDVLVRALPQPGELDTQDNERTVQIEVLDARIAVLYVDGYPRWDYRYIKNEMIRDKTVEISCLLTSADVSFAQEGDRPVRRFPERIEELMDYDVVLFGDVDPRQFTDHQLQMLSTFVAAKGGGFGMVAGPQWSPRAYRNTAIEPMLPVLISSDAPAAAGTITQGFRPVVTAVGLNSSIFRFFADRQENQRYLTQQWPMVFWYCRGITAKPGVGEVFAEHPVDSGPDGHKAPILVMGRFGAGRTMFSAIDDSWRWRFYTGESIFDTYWVQQLRYLARGRKLGQRRVSLVSLRREYQPGEPVVVQLRVLDPQLASQLADKLTAQLSDEQGQVIARPVLTRQGASSDLYVGSWTADRIGTTTLQVAQLAGDVPAMTLPIRVSTPRLELLDPRIDRDLLARLANETSGQMVDPGDARSVLPDVITSAAKVVPVEITRALWGAPIVMGLLVILLTAEWIIRKVVGLL